MLLPSAFLEDAVNNIRHVFFSLSHHEERVYGAYENTAAAATLYNTCLEECTSSVLFFSDELL